MTLEPIMDFVAVLYTCKFRATMQAGARAWPGLGPGADVSTWSAVSSGPEVTVVGLAPARTDMPMWNTGVMCA